MNVERVERFAENPWLNGPGQYLVKSLAAQLLIEPTFKIIFGEFIDGYMRQDYDMRNLPALRIYNEQGEKTSEDWFIDGEITMDVIFPASIRRLETQDLPAMTIAATINQFRRPSFFSTMGGLVPGLNRLGRTVKYDNSMAFNIGDGMCPLTQMKIDFRVDLRQWDRFLESDYRTKNDPFIRTLEDLRRIVVTTQALADDNKTVESTTQFNVKTRS